MPETSDTWKEANKISTVDNYCDSLISSNDEMNCHGYILSNGPENFLQIQRLDEVERFENDDQAIRQCMSDAENGDHYALSIIRSLMIDGKKAMKNHRREVALTHDFFRTEHDLELMEPGIYNFERDVLRTHQAMGMKNAQIKMEKPDEMISTRSLFSLRV